MQAATEHGIHFEEPGERLIDLLLALRQAKPRGGGFQIRPDLVEALDGVAHLLPGRRQGSCRDL